MSALISWVCPRVLDEKDRVVNVGCGGNWGPVMPSRCPTCKGPLRETQRLMSVPVPYTEEPK